VAIYIALPFFLKSGAQENEFSVISDVRTVDPTAEKLKSLDNQKEALYSAIKDIEFDYGLGKLSEDDYGELKNKYKLEAAAVLKEMDQTQIKGGTKGPDYELEQEIMSYRSKEPENLTEDKKIEEEISAFRSASKKTKKENKCSECGSQHSSEDMFCSKCGAKLN